MIIGPDGGELNDLVRLCRQLNLSEAVSFLGPMGIDDIPTAALDAAFYLQTSNFEGMAMSVVEAMQLGLVPVVTPVGEIANYCEQGKSAILVSDDAEIPRQIQNLLEHPDRYQEMRLNAISRWQNKPTYAESIISESRRLLEGEQ